MCGGKRGRKGGRETLVRGNMESKETRVGGTDLRRMKRRRETRNG